VVEQNRSSSYTEIVYSIGGRKLALMTGQSLQKAFVSLPGGGTAVYTSSGLAYYRHADWLGSSRLASTPSRTLYFSNAYAPYGEGYTGTGTTDVNFTGQNQDTVTGLNDFMFREYAPPQGRWISPDPAGTAAVDPMNPQSWNRYAYVINNPTGLVDPLGLCPPWSIPGHCAEVQQSYNWLIGNSGVTIDGMAVDVGIVNSLLGTGVGAACNGTDCSQIRQDPDTGQWQQRNPAGGERGPDGEPLDPWTDYHAAPVLVLLAQGPAQGPIDNSAANNPPPGAPKPPNPILKYDKCATAVRSQAKKDKWTITVIQHVTFGDLLAGCGFTGPDAPLCVGVVGGVSGTVGAVKWAGYLDAIWEGETKCLREN
jgi:RHS repeat-associated protein